MIDKSSEISSITGTIVSSGHIAAGFHGSDGVFRATYSGTEIDVAWAGTGSHMRVDMDISRSVPTANENRPRNMAVRYLIRAAK